MPEARGPEESPDRLLAAYAARLDDPDAAARAETARAWCRWESMLETVRPDPDAVEAWLRDTRRVVALARIECHYMRHGCFLDPPDRLLRAARGMAAIPAAIVHGRLDRICPVGTAEDLAAAMPHAALDLVDGGGHASDEPAMAAALVRAADAFRERLRDAEAC